MSRKVGLGKGLDALLPNSDNTQPKGGSVTLASITSIVPNPHQPRLSVSDEELRELADSIREHGIIQPLIVTYDGENSRYILIAGERRLRAAGLVGLEMVPVVVRSATDQEMLELALIENLQRSDLSPLETAEAYHQLDEVFKLTHDEIAVRVGKSRTAVTNTIRLLKLPLPVRTALQGEKITEGHARALLALRTPQAQISALQTILKHDLTVRLTEALVQQLNGERPERTIKKETLPEIHAIEERLLSALGTKVSLHHGKNGGTITIHYFSEEELEALIHRFTGE
jgi:ParB family transcriptional regulator, chromosome partitioning protein